MIEMIGYIASVVIAVSLMMKKIRKLRWYNLIGAGLMSAYGFMLGSLPVALLNLFIAFVDIYYLWQMYGKKEYYKLLEMPADRVYLEYFLNFYKEDIKRYFPNFDFQVKEENMHLVVLRNLIPAGLMIACQKDECLHIDIEYVIPEYRDNKIGDFLFNKQQEYFFRKGIKCFITDPHSESFEKYLKYMGFVQKEDAKYHKEIEKKW